MTPKNISTLPHFANDLSGFAPPEIMSNLQPRLTYLSEKVEGQTPRMHDDNIPAAVLAGHDHRSDEESHIFLNQK